MPGAGALEGAFFSLLFGATGRYALAADEMALFLDTPPAHEGPRRYWQALGAFWRALADGEAATGAAGKVSKQYGSALAARCLVGLSDTAELFSPKDWPVCPDCDRCALKKRCVRVAAEALALRLKRIRP
jgi:hypothetical protein